jgi:hypothetical protein
VVWTVVVVEAGGYAALRVLSDRAPLLFEIDLEAMLASLDAERIAAHASGSRPGVAYLFDRALGWVRAPDRSVPRPHGLRMTTDPRGSRVVPGATGPVWIATYGDSFTEGLDVNDEDTWQAVLARSTGTRVWNFGVAGYGPDQALLLLERNERDGVGAPVVVLAMIDENRNRLVNFVPRFYNQTAGAHMSFKPRFVETGTGWSVASFMPEDPTDLEALRAALVAAARVDPFIALRRHRVAFPYSVRAAAFLWRWGLEPRIPWPGGTPEAWAILEAVTDRFVALSERRGFVPVLVRLPQSPGEIVHFDAPRHARARERLSRPGLVYVDVVEVLAGADGPAVAPGFDPATYLSRLHPSAAGNAAIAAVLEDALRRAGAGPATAASGRGD